MTLKIVYQKSGVPLVAGKMVPESGLHVITCSLYTVQPVLNICRPCCERRLSDVQSISIDIIRLSNTLLVSDILFFDDQY